MGYYKNSLKNRIKLLRKRPAHRLKIFFDYLFKRREIEPVFVIATRRSGSNLLLGYLNSIPDASFASEILNASMFYGIRNRLISKSAVLRHIVYSLNHCESKICGAKLLNVQLDTHRLSPEDLKKHFPCARFIILHRKTLLRQFVSLKIAETTGVWQWTDGDYPPPPAVRISIPEFQHYQRNINSFYKGLSGKKWLKDCSIKVSYEDLADDAQKVFDELIFPFLRLPQSKVSSPARKQSPDELRKIVENYREIEPFLFDGQEGHTSGVIHSPVFEVRKAS